MGDGVEETELKDIKIENEKKLEVEVEDDDTDSIGDSLAQDEELLTTLENGYEKNSKVKSRKPLIKKCCKYGFAVVVVMMFLAIIVIMIITSHMEGQCHDSAEQVFVQGIKGHLWELHKIGTAHSGSRTAGTGYNASSDYIISQLDHSFYTIRKQHFTIPEIKEVEPPTLTSALGNKSYVRGKEFEALSGFHGKASFHGIIDSVDEYGCNEIDFRYFKVGNIALIKRGNCSFADKGNNAKKYGAIGVVVYNTVDDLIRGSIGPITIPVFMITKSIADVWMGESGALTIHMSAHAELHIYYTHNIIAYRKGADPKVVVVGAHLDSVQAGRGINDNGSGSMTILQVAHEVAQRPNWVRNSIMFAWWAGEELGLLGSTYYVNSLSKSELSNILCNLNFDMLASPNYVRAVYDGSSANDISIRKGSAFIQAIFENYFNRTAKLSSQLTPFDGRSDYGPFIENGVPAGGLFSGAEKYKTEEEREEVFGISDVAYDPCYHQHCDSYYNLNFLALEEMSLAVLYSVRYLVEYTNLISKLQ